jgi:hypothetical protein
MFTLYAQESMIKSHALIDCSTTSYAFIDEDYTYHHHLYLYLLKSPSHLTVIDAQPVTLGVITHKVHIPLAILDYQANIPLFVPKSENYPIAIRVLWLQQYDMYLHFTKNKVMFDSNYYLSYCLEDTIHVQGTIQDPPAPAHLNSITRPLSHLVLNVQETLKVIPHEYHNLFPLFLEEGL